MTFLDLLEPPSPRVLPRHLVAVFLLAAGVAALLRWSSFGEPPERDLEIYSTVSSALLQGSDLYSEVLDIKPPGIFLIYALFQSVLGSGPQLFFAIGIFFAAFTAGAIYVLLRVHEASQVIASAGAVLWLWVSVDLSLQANQPNAEVAMNALLVTGLAFGSSAERKVLRWLAAGLAFALATFVKQSLGPIVLLFAVALSLSRSGVRDRLTVIGLVLVPSALLWLAAFGWFAADGRGALFWHLIIDYPREYATIFGKSMAGALMEGLGGPLFGPEGGRVVVTASVLLSIGAFAFSMVRRRWRDGALLAAWTVGTWFTVSAPGHFYAHYYQLWLPLLSFSAAYLVSPLWAQARATPRIVSISAIAALALTVGWRTPANLTMQPEEWSHAKYGADFTEYEAFAANVNAMLHPDDTVFVWGVYPSVYRVTQRRPPTGIANIWLTIPAYGGSYSSLWTDQLLADLLDRLPDVIVVDRFTLNFTPQSHPVKQLLERRYRTIAKSGDRILLAARDDSELLKRLRATGSLGRGGSY